MLFLVLLLFIARADAPIELPPIVKTGSASDLIQDDAIVPIRSLQTSLNSSSGSMHEDLRNELPLPLLDQGAPGATTQFRGLGRSAEDIGVQTLGVSLNPAQGGGYDMSVFPQFLWDGYRYQAGPSLGAFDSHANSGTLTLTPWSAKALDQKEQAAARLTQFYSGRGVVQSSVATKGSGIAAVAGYSSGDFRGPSGSLSTAWSAGSIKGRFHFLGSQINSAVPGSRTFPTPHARQISSRLIPVAEIEVPTDESSVLKSSFFYDNMYLKYDDPSSPSMMTRDRVQQVGTENAYWNRGWKAGLTARRAMYDGIGFNPPEEYVSSAQISRLLAEGDFAVEPSLQAVAVSRFGFYPAGSLGVRKDWDSGSRSSKAVFLRGSFSRRFPSLVDRYYSVGIYSGNPALIPEKDWTWIVGVETSTPFFKISGELYHQLRVDAHAPTPLQISNSGTARVTALIQSMSIQPLSWVELQNSVTLSHSRLDSTGQAFPYLARAVDVMGISFYPYNDPAPLKISASARFSSSAISDTAGNRVAGYGYFDLEARGRIYAKMYLTGRVFNLTDRPVEFFKDYPLNRSASLLWVGEF